MEDNVWDFLKHQEGSPEGLENAVDTLIGYTKKKGFPKEENAQLDSLEMVKYTIICEEAALVLSNDWKEFMEYKKKNRGRLREKVFYICNGEKPDCTKKHCYRKGGEEVCRHTTDIRFAKNFKEWMHREYMENLQHTECAADENTSR